MPGNNAGQSETFVWNLSSFVTTAADLANGRVRLLNSDTGGKKIYMTYTVIDTTLGGGGS